MIRTYKISKNCSFQNILTIYCEKYDLKKEEISLYYNNNEIYNLNQTPEHYNIKNGETLMSIFYFKIVNFIHKLVFPKFIHIFIHNTHNEDIFDIKLLK